MEIINSSYIPSAKNLQGTSRTPAEKTTEQGGSASAIRDSVLFSEEALRLTELAPNSTEPSKIRFDLVNRIKSEIAAGTYDTPEKMDIAIGRMASRIF
jgi:anti-sigma28 factor (negative regulator of flagellin synthesis)